jgi:hypothetical protein
MGILDPVLCFEAHPLNIVFLGHGMGHFADAYMDDVSLKGIYGNVLLSGSFCGVGAQFFHDIAATVERNAHIPKHGNRIAAMLTN